MSTQLLDLRQGLILDIEALRVQILRLESQKLKCESAIIEIDIMVAHPTTIREEGDGPPLPPEEELTVVAMARAVLPQFRGKTFWYSDIKAAAIKQHPEQESKVRRGIYPACKVLKEKSEIIAVSGGFKLPEDCE